MAVKVLALASGVTGLADHRMLNSALLVQDGNTGTRSGIFHGPSNGSLSTVSAMVARIAPLRCVINNSISNVLGPYVVVSDANVDITFDNGEASVTRTDRIIVRVRDDVNDGSGSTAGSVEYLKGQASGAATALPNNSLLLFEVNVPAGASAGGGGINFGAATTDFRTHTVANGGVIAFASNTAMTAMTNVNNGQVCFRTDLDCFYVYNGSVWEPKGQISVAASANLSGINNPWDGLIAVTRDTDALYIYNGSSYVQPKHFFKPIGRIVANSTQSLADNTITAIAFAGTDDIDTHAQHDPSSNNTRVTPNVAGYYKFKGTVMFASRDDYNDVNSWIRKNGGTNLAPAFRLPYATDSGNALFPGVISAPCEATQSMNGTTDYIELVAQQNNAANVSSNTNQSNQFSSTLEWEYLGPTSY
jgi:hypothetical protein